MRGTVRGLANPAPYGSRLPAVLQEDEFLQRFLLGFDDAIAPVFTTLDNLEWYVRPGTTPADFLDWLGSWVDVELDEDWSVEHRRRVVAEVASLHRMAGTPRGVLETMQLVAGPDATVELTESGGTSWSPTARGKLPGEPGAQVRVRVRMGKGGAKPVESPGSAKRDPVEELRQKLERAARRVMPAHVHCEIEVTKAGAA
ncbi:phage tail protein [Agromyces intestinalis]|uniref:Phage tail protein n=1 Tax=Agromyces intestinalis TaxID=2592652 RepID=A0A5C1YDD0_9MICO|nr:phage tail protein [Agromyces intestinalis]QEO14091.1 phage tail protein [Agromyces intestinalis]